MPNLNRATIMGNLTKDVKRYTPNGTAVADLRVAVNRKWTQNGQTKEEVTYLGVVVWAKTAEACSQYLRKGSPVYVEGRLQVREEYEKDGGKRYITIVADNVQFLGTRGAGGARPEPAEGPGSGGGDDVPF